MAIGACMIAGGLGNLRRHTVPAGALHGHGPMIGLGVGGRLPAAAGSGVSWLFDAAAHGGSCHDFFRAICAGVPWPTIFEAGIVGAGRR